MPRSGCRGAIVVLAIAFGSAVARAQAPATPYTGERRLGGGGEVALVGGRVDGDAFFNYTDYEHDALRLARLRLFGTWRATPALDFHGEVRTENGDHVELAAAYLRWQPYQDGTFELRAGRIAPVIGAFPNRVYGRDNPVIGAPLAYQYLVALRPDALPATSDDLVRMRGRGWQPTFPLGAQQLAPGLPLISAFRWGTGVSAHWAPGLADLSGAITLGAPAAPATVTTDRGATWSGRAAVHLPAGITLGVSGARGVWVDRAARALALSSHDSFERTLGVDAQIGLGRWLVQGEWIAARFDVPTLAADPQAAAVRASSGFLEARYRLHPRWQIALRADRLDFSTIRDHVTNTDVTWDAPVDRLEVAVGFRITRRTEARLGWQDNWRDGGRVRQRGYPALQLLVAF